MMGIEADVEKKISEDIICCDSLVKIFESEQLKVMALQGLDMNIKSGEMIAVIGKSGSGKSTLLNIIGGLETPSAGQIFVQGKDLSRLQEDEMVEYRRSTVGFVWQKSSQNLFPYMTALENVEAPMHFSKIDRQKKRTRALKLLSEVGMEKHSNKYPAQLSGGEQQRVAIAVALANNPAILLADEPTGAVDTGTANDILKLFYKLNKENGITIIIVTHDMELADMVHRTVMISDGKVSVEKVRKKTITLSEAEFTYKDSYEDSAHEIYSVLDKANRLKLDDEVLKQAGIDSNKVKVELVNGKIVISGDNRYIEVQQQGDGGVKNMCEAMERAEQKGIEKGIKEGIKEGKIQILIELVRKGNLSIAIAAETAGITIEEFQELLIEK